MYHKILIVGNLGRDPEMRYTPGGQPVTNFSVATNRSYTSSDGEQVDETIWFRVSTWGRMAEVCNQYLAKGRKVLVEGRLRPDPQTGNPRIWTGQDSQPHASFEVTAQTVQFLSGKGAGNGGAENGGAEGDDAADQIAPEEEAIPF